MGHSNHHLVGEEEGASAQEEYWQISGGHSPSHLVGDSLVHLVVDVLGPLSKGKEGHQPSYVSDPFQVLEGDVSVPFQVVVSFLAVRPTVAVVGVASVLEDGKGVELVAG